MEAAETIEAKLRRLFEASVPFNRVLGLKVESIEPDAPKLRRPTHATQIGPAVGDQNDRDRLQDQLLRVDHLRYLREVGVEVGERVLLLPWKEDSQLRLDFLHGAVLERLYRE